MFYFPPKEKNKIHAYNKYPPKEKKKILKNKTHAYKNYAGGVPRKKNCVFFEPTPNRTISLC